MSCMGNEQTVFEKLTLSNFKMSHDIKDFNN